MDNWSSKIAGLQALGWSLKELGQAVGISAQALSDIKQGRTKSPSGMAAVRLHELSQTSAAPPAPGA